jgi:hypothetical protein
MCVWGGWGGGGHIYHELTPLIMYMASTAALTGNSVADKTGGGGATTCADTFE